MENPRIRSALSFVACLGLIFVGGCRVCDSCDDCAYPTYGGSWERTNRNHGRVGSVFAPAGAKVAATAAAPPLTTENWNPNANDDEGEDDDTRSLLDDLEDELPEPEADEANDET